MAATTTTDNVPKGSDLVRQLMPFITGKTILTTGVSPGGLGASFVETVAAGKPAMLILAGRNATKCQQTAEKIANAYPDVQTRVLELDLASQAAVRRAADTVLAWDDVPSIDALVLNAGIMATKEFTRTEDGLEVQFGANYVGHWLFGNLVMSKVLAGTGVGVDGGKVAGGRVVSVSSDGVRLDCVRFDDLDFNGGETYNAWRAYGQSKTGNCLYAVSLAKKLGPKGVVAMSLHPGVISTNLSSHIEGLEDLRQLDKEQGWGADGFKRVSFDQGVATHIFAGFSPEAARHNGAYCHEASVAPAEQVKCWARDEVEAARLWRVTEELVGQKFDW